MSKRREPSRGARHIAEARIAAEQLVSTQPRERDLQPGTARGEADEVGVHAVGRRLIHRTQECGAFGVKIFARHPDGLVLRAVVPGDFLGQRHLVIGGATKLGEAQRDGAQSPALLGRQPRERGRIQPGGEKHTDGHIGDQMVTHRVDKRGPHGALRLCDLVASGGHAEDFPDAAVGSGDPRAIRARPQPAARWQ